MDKMLGQFLRDKKGITNNDHDTIQEESNHSSTPPPHTSQEEEVKHQPTPLAVASDEVEHDQPNSGRTSKNDSSINTDAIVVNDNSPKLLIKTEEQLDAMASASAKSATFSPQLQKLKEGTKSLILDELKKVVSSEVDKNLKRMKTGNSNNLNDPPLSPSASFTTQQRKRAPSNLTGGTAAVEGQYQQPDTLDLFALETRARRTIGELIKPIVTEMAVDRQKVAQTLSKQARIDKRLVQLEYVLKLNETKPQVFVDIENKIADVRADMVQIKEESVFRVDLCDQNIERLRRDVQSCVHDMKGMESLTKMRDEQTKRTNETANQMKLTFGQEVHRLERMISNTQLRIDSQINSCITNVQKNNGKIDDFEIMIKEMHILVAKAYETSCKNTQSIDLMFSTKTNNQEYTRVRDDLYQQIETIKFATYDNFRVVRATDNFIEKYLPFQIQEIVSNNIRSFVQRPFTLEQQNKQRVITEIQKAELNRFENFRQAEYENYKRFHREVLNDDGLPTIKKTTFHMPGYRQILSDKQEEGYIIDNERVYDKMYAQNKEIEKKNKLIDSSDMQTSEDPMQDIMALPSQTDQHSNYRNGGNFSATSKNKFSLQKKGINSSEKSLAQEKTNKNIKVAAKLEIVQKDKNDSNNGQDPDESFEANEALLEEQDRIETRQIKNIHKMMNYGDKKHEKRRQASPFLKYAIKKYEIPQDDDDVKGQTATVEEDFTNIQRHISNSMADPTVGDLDKTVPPSAAPLNLKSLITINDRTNAVSKKSSQPSVTESASGASSVCELPVQPIHLKNKAVSQALKPIPHQNTFQIQKIAKQNSNLMVSQEKKEQKPAIKRKGTLIDKRKLTSDKESSRLFDNLVVPLDDQNASKKANFADDTNTKEPSPEKNQQLLDLITNLEANTYHDRRQATHYLVGFEDMEPIVSEMIKTSSVTSNKNASDMYELQKEMAEFKSHVEKMTNNTDMPFLKPMKAIIDEQVTVMYSFQREVRNEIRTSDARQVEFEFIVQNMQEQVRKLFQHTVIQGELNSIADATNRHSMSPIDKIKYRREEVMQKLGSKQQLSSAKTATQHQLCSSQKTVLTNLTNRSRQQQHQSRQQLQRSSRSPVHGTGLMIKDTTPMQEVLIDIMKLQNIFNFEIHKQLQPPQLSNLNNNLVGDQVIIKDNNKSSIATNTQPQVSRRQSKFFKQSMDRQNNQNNALQQSQNSICEVNLYLPKAQKLLMTEIKDHAGAVGVTNTTDFDLNGDLINYSDKIVNIDNADSVGEKLINKKKHIADNQRSSSLTLGQQQMSGINFNKDINLWQDQQQKQQQQQQQQQLLAPSNMQQPNLHEKLYNNGLITCGSVITMLEQIRHKYEELMIQQQLRQSQQSNTINAAGIKGGTFLDIEMLKTDRQTTANQTNSDDLFNPMTALGQHQHLNNGPVDYSIPVQTLNLDSSRGGLRSHRVGSARQVGGHKHKRTHTMQNNHKRISQPQHDQTQHQNSKRLSNNNDQDAMMANHRVYKKVNMSHNLLTSSNKNILSSKPRGGTLAHGVTGLGVTGVSSIPSLTTQHGMGSSAPMTNSLSMRTSLQIQKQHLQLLPRNQARNNSVLSPQPEQNFAIEDSQVNYQQQSKVSLSGIAVPNTNINSQQQQ